MTFQKQRSKSSRSSPKSKRERCSTKKAWQGREVALAELKDDFSEHLRLAAKQEIVPDTGMGALRRRR